MLGALSSGGTGTSGAQAAPGAAELPVRSGEKPWTDAELTELREQLKSEATGLRAEIDAAASQIAERLIDAVGDAGDDEADAGARHSSASKSWLDPDARDLLDQSERALAKIDAGKYGVCESCGKPIGKARQMAFPRATLCVECKQREERR